MPPLQIYLVDHELPGFRFPQGFLKLLLLNAGGGLIPEQLRNQRRDYSGSYYTKNTTRHYRSSDTEKCRYNAGFRIAEPRS